MDWRVFSCNITVTTLGEYETVDILATRNTSHCQNNGFDLSLQCTVFEEFRQIFNGNSEVVLK